MSNVLKIALSGGPCAGKTTIINELKKEYESRGYCVFVVQEAAREIIAEGISRDDMLLFEAAVAKRQLENENAVAIDNCENDIIVLYDRGVVDAFGYLNAVDKAALQNELGISTIEAWGRYDAVLFLETSALCDNYVNDPQRSESTEEAVECHKMLLNEWIGHSHFRYIKAAKSPSDKLIAAMHEIDVLLQNLEYEKKYLIKYPPDELFNNYPCFKAETEQIYLLSDKGSHRIRRRGANGIYQYFETLKIRLSGDKCIEYEGTISEDRYNELKSLANPDKHPIVKDRYCLLYKGQYFEIDIFPFWNDKALVEIELSSKGQLIELPPEIRLLRDVSKDKEYKNNYLAGLKL